MPLALGKRTADRAAGQKLGAGPEAGRCSTGGGGDAGRCWALQRQPCAWRWALQRQPKLWRLMERGATGVELPPNPGLVPGRVRCGGGEGGTGDNHAMVMPLVNLAMLSFQLAPRVSTAFDTCRSRTCEGRPSMVERTLGERLRTEFDSMMVEVALERKANLVEVSMTNSNAPAVHPLFLNRTDPTRAV